MRTAAQGHTVLSPSAARRLIAASTDSLSARDRARKLVRSLTEREVQVLAGLGEGLSNAQIAARLKLSEATIKGYVSRMRDKLDCLNRTQAGLIAHDAGIVDYQEPVPHRRAGRESSSAPRRRTSLLHQLLQYRNLPKSWPRSRKRADT